LTKRIANRVNPLVPVACKQQIARRSTDFSASFLLLGCALLGQAGAAPPAAPGTPQPVLRADGTFSVTTLESDRAPASSDPGRIQLNLSAAGYIESEHIVNEGIGARTDDNGVWNTRLNVYANMIAYDRFRAFVAVKHGGRSGYGGFVPPVERDPIDLHQAIAELRVGDALGLRKDDILLRLGRQELHYGSGRMISIRQGPNLRQDFDGGLVRVRKDSFIADGFAFLDVVDRVGSFNNRTSESNGLWGVYGSLAGERGRSLDLYYIGERRDRSSFVQTTADETRHSFGTRVALAPSGDVNSTRWSGDIEATAQFGRAKILTGQALNVRAWSLSGTLSYALAMPWQPKLVTTFGVTSGDRNPLDSTIGTFRAPRPPGRYFAPTVPFGPGNIMGGSLAMSLVPVKGFSMEPRAIALWRQTARDGTYTPSGAVVRRANGAANFIGWDLGASARWQIDKNFAVHAELGRFKAGAYMRANPPARDVTRWTVGVDFAF
jgi:hypothetical protein